MTSLEPEPRQSPEPQSQNKVPPGETPPAETGISGISYPEPELRGKGWGALPIIVIGLVVVLVAVGLIAMVVELDM
jgi:hypothetical protein